MDRPCNLVCIEQQQQEQQQEQGSVKRQNERCSNGCQDANTAINKDESAAHNTAKKGYCMSLIIAQRKLLHAVGQFNRAVAATEAF